MKQMFYGGVHPAEHKEATEQKPIQPLANAPAQVVIPMSMHIGAPCKPVVQKGDTVTVGQKIGETAGLGAPIHASVSGTVVAVEPRPGTGGTPTLSVVIENDFQNTLCPDCKPRENVDALTSQEIIDIIREAGCTGMGGAGFPTHVKISSAVGKADTIIINGAECEPYITADHRLMLEHGEKIIGGVRFIMKALQLDHAYIGIEDNKMNAVNHLKELVGGAKDITVQALRTRYPQGAEKQLIQAITGREVPPGKLPADVGCCVFNAATTAAIYDAVVLGQPVYQRVITVTGSAVKNPVNLLAPVGTPFSHLIEEAGGFNGTPARVISGDGVCPVRHVGDHGKGQQLRALPEQGGSACHQCQSHLHPLRPLRQRLPHAPDPPLYEHVRQSPPLERGGGRVPDYGLHGMRKLPVCLPG